MSAAAWRAEVRTDLDEGSLERIRAVGAAPISGRSSPGLVSTTLILRAHDEITRGQDPHSVGGNLPIAQLTRFPAWVHAPVDDDTVAAFEHAAGTDPRIGGVVEDGPQRTMETYFVLDSKSPDEPAGPMWITGLRTLIDD
jgi:hypothetical protein